MTAVSSVRGSPPIKHGLPSRWMISGQNFLRAGPLILLTGCLFGDWWARCNILLAIYACMDQACNQFRDLSQVVGGEFLAIVLNQLDRTCSFFHAAEKK